MLIGRSAGKLADRKVDVGGCKGALAEDWDGAMATVVSEKLLDTHIAYVL